MKDLRLQSGHLGNTIDLRLHQNVNHAKMLHLKKDTITHTELLAAINQLNSILQVHVNGKPHILKELRNTNKVLETPIRILSTANF